MRGDLGLQRIGDPDQEVIPDHQRVRVTAIGIATPEPARPVPFESEGRHVALRPGLSLTQRL